MNLTDNEIIKALECCAEILHDITTCEECPFEEIETPVCVAKSVTNALELINRQKAKIEWLHEVINGFEEQSHKELQNFLKLSEKYTTAKAEAIKEFAESLKAEYIFWKLEDGSLRKIIPIYAIDYLVKEKVGE